MYKRQVQGAQAVTVQHFLKKEKQPGIVRFQAASDAGGGGRTHTLSLIHISAGFSGRDAARSGGTLMRPNIENFIGCDSSYRAASSVLYGAPYDLSLIHI